MIRLEVDFFDNSFYYTYSCFHLTVESHWNVSWALHIFSHETLKHNWSWVQFNLMPNLKGLCSEYLALPKNRVEMYIYVQDFIFILSAVYATSSSRGMILLPPWLELMTSCIWVSHDWKCEAPKKLFNVIPQLNENSCKYLIWLDMAWYSLTALCCLESLEEAWNFWVAWLKVGQAAHECHAPNLHLLRAAWSAWNTFKHGQAHSSTSRTSQPKNEFSWCRPGHITFVRTLFCCMPLFLPDWITWMGALLLLSPSDVFFPMCGMVCGVCTIEIITFSWQWQQQNKNPSLPLPCLFRVLPFLIQCTSSGKSKIYLADT